MNERFSSLKPHVLLISSKHDFSTDHIVFHLNQRGVPYLRLNRDQFPDFRIALVPTIPSLSVESPNFSAHLTADSLRSIYFRAPTYLRDIYQPGLAPEEQLKRTQWAAFVRGLTVFETSYWINHPHTTYQAEIKPFQIRLAQQVGFHVPATVVSNAAEFGTHLAPDRDDLIIKTLDPIILKTGQREAFIYTNTIKDDELVHANLAGAPVVMQERLCPKTDVRVTVVRDKVFAATITSKGRGIDADWRTTNRGELEYEQVELPKDIVEKCKRLTRTMQLKFGAIDLAFSRDKYYFLEINPTGEWAWLTDSGIQGIDDEISTALIEARDN